ncbi:hypothetical protein ACLOJK_008085 [Asimina triloba]
MEMVGRIIRLLRKKVLLAVASTGRGRLATVGCWTEEAWLVWNCYPHRIAPPWPDLAVMMGEVLADVENQRGDGGGHCRSSDAWEEAVMLYLPLRWRSLAVGAHHARRRQWRKRAKGAAVVDCWHTCCRMTDG